MHTLQPADIESIVTNNLLQKGTKRYIQHKGKELFEQWKALSPEDRIGFCERVVKPRIKGLQNGTKRNALQVYYGIQEDISEHALQAAATMESHRQSARKVAAEMLACYELIERIGRGVVYLGSARTKPGDHEYELARELGREVAQLTGLPSWSGAGPGAMEAPLMGAKEAGGKVGGIKIRLGAENLSFEQEINGALTQEDVATCDKFAPRKIGLVDAAMSPDGLVVTFPGGFGTNDEFFEVLTLKQLRKLSDSNVQILLMSYNGYYDLLLRFMEHQVKEGKVSQRDMSLFKVFETNREALDYIANTRGIHPEKRLYNDSPLLGEEEEEHRVA